MQYKTHIAVSLVIGLPVMEATDTLSVSAVLALTLGATFPDVDEPHSWIGRRTRGISDFIHALFGHRGITHSLMGLLFISLVTLLLTNIVGINVLFGVYFVLGYALHLLEDSFSKSGIAWLQPFKKKKYKSGLGVVYYKTGGLVEKLILVISVLVLIFELLIFMY